MTLNQQNNAINKSHGKEVLHMFLALFVKNDGFCLFDLEIDVLTFKMILSYKNNTKNGLPSQNNKKTRYYICS